MPASWEMQQNRPDNHDPFNTGRPVVHTLGFWRRLLFYPLALMACLYMRTWRFRLDPSGKDKLGSIKGPRILVSWHNRSLVSAEFVRRHLQPERIATLISPSRLAAWEVALFRFLGLQVIRGSTTRRSIQASMEILRHLKAGGDVGISPDGPSGPLYAFQSGATALAHKAGVPLVLIATSCHLARRLRTWDRHMLPYPFATVRVVIKSVAVDSPVWQQPIEQATEQIRQDYLEMTHDPF